MEAIAGNLSPSSASYGCYCLHSLLLMNAIAGNLSLFMFLAGNLSLFTFLVIRRESIVGLPLPEARLSQSPVKGFGMVLIGCDGVNSIVSEWLGLQPAKFMGRSTSRGLSTYPEGHDFDPKLYINRQHGIRTGYIPINDTDVFWFLNRKSLPQDSETAQEPKLIIQEALDLLRDFPEEYHDIVKRTLPDTPSLSSLRCRCPWAVLVGRLSKGTVTIAGDAMHAMTPYIGQGGCSTLEDAVILGRCLAEGMNGKMDSSTKEERKRIEEALKKYIEERRWRVFMLMTKSYITGLLQPGSGRFAKFLREKIMTKVFNNALSHAEYDCGGLFDTMKQI